MNKKTYITPQTTLVKCHIEGVMQQLSKTGGESKVDPNTPIAPPQGGTGGAGTANPFAKETFNLTKQGELLKSNPEQAKAMAAAAGVTI